MNPVANVKEIIRAQRSNSAISLRACYASPGTDSERIMFSVYREHATALPPPPRSSDVAAPYRARSAELT
eukprot:801302-Rhodomonas_salina.1